MSFLLLLEIDAINRFYLVKSVLSHELSVRFMKTEPPLFHEICIRPVWAPKSHLKDSGPSDSKQSGPATGYAFVSSPVSA